MELQDIYENVANDNSKDTPGPPTQNHSQDEGKDGKCRGSRCLVLVIVCLGILCLLLIAGITLQFFFQATSKQGFLWGPGVLFIYNDSKNWSECRQFCRDRGADLVIINTEEKQRHITSLVKERVWIGLSDSETEGIMKWVDNSALKQGFWADGEPNNFRGEDEDCIELDPQHTLNNWNDLKCSEKKKGICEK
ncbi:hypothetical protein R3I93_005656 [Phoxinus phoxinus]|uniref:C-type lectin domain-containing protein n=1 Tax=Phoxinus phoxinus TaxID=58324 RepID=A0AAN9HDE6_9TELE